MEVSDPIEIEALFAKTKIDEIQSMLTFLNSLKTALSMAFYNGSRPAPSLFSGGSDLQGLITREVEQFLLKAAGATQYGEGLSEP
jgi:hypothetical protein